MHSTRPLNLYIFEISWCSVNGNMSLCMLVVGEAQLAQLSKSSHFWTCVASLFLLAQQLHQGSFHGASLGPLAAPFANRTCVTSSFKVWGLLFNVKIHEPLLSSLFLYKSAECYIQKIIIIIIIITLYCKMKNICAQNNNVTKVDEFGLARWEWILTRNDREVGLVFNQRSWTNLGVFNPKHRNQTAINFKNIFWLGSWTGA